MKYGFYLPTRGALAEPEALAALVSSAEAKGFHSVMKIAVIIELPIGM